MDLGFFFRKGRYLPKLGWELIRFLQAKEQPRLAVWEAQHAQFLHQTPQGSKDEINHKSLSSAQPSAFDPDQKELHPFMKRCSRSAAMNGC